MFLSEHSVAVVVLVFQIKKQVKIKVLRTAGGREQ